MDRLQEIIRYLTAAGGTPARDGNSTHFTYEEEGSIRMRTWTGSELIDNELIADEVRPGTSAPIVNRSHKRIFVVHKDNSIKCFTDPLGDNDQVEADEIDDDAPWNEEEIAGVDTRVHPRSQLAVSYDKNTVFVFYQKPDGTLGCINEYNNQWKEVKLPAVAALSGTPLATCNTNYAVFLFYISIDGTVRYLENREGKWNDVFFSAAKILNPKAKLSGSTFRLTVAEDRQPFERIRPLVFCLDNNNLSVLKFRGKKLDTIGRVGGTEFVPSLGIKERNKYYFWSPYPFYTMIKRRGNIQAQATISQGLWDKRPSPRQKFGKSSAMKSLNKLQDPSKDNHSTSMVNNNKTSATVAFEAINAPAIFSPQTSEQGETPSGTSARSSIFVGFGSVSQPWNALKRRLFGTKQNEDATEEDAPENTESNHAGITDALPQANESETSHMERGAIKLNEPETTIFETREVMPKEDEREELENDEHNIRGIKAEESLVREDRPEEDLLEEADSEGTEEEAGSEGTHSEAAETAPSEVEAEIEENQSLKVQTEEFQKEEVEDEESEDEESEDEESEDEESEYEELEGKEVEGEETQHEEKQAEEAQTKEIQTEEGRNGEIKPEKSQIKESQTNEVQSREVQIDAIQPDERRTRSIQAEETRRNNPLTDDAPTNDTKSEEYDAEVSNIGEVKPNEPKPKNITWGEPEPEFVSDKAGVPPAEPSTLISVEGLPVIKPSITMGNGQGADVAKSGLETPGPEAAEHNESPPVKKGKDLATTDKPFSNEPIFNTPKDIQEDMTGFIKKAGLHQLFPNDSPLVPTLADNAFKSKNREGNLLNRDVDLQGIARLSLYQPVLYCDDSTSMKANSRVDDQKEMVRRVTRVSTSIVPAGYGTSLQFINHVRDVHNDKLSQQEVEEIMNSVKPSGHTRIGHNLKDKILKPLVYDVIRNNKRLERPILVSCITDGCPSDESTDTLKKEILKCTRFLRENGYPPSTILFQVSQIGDSSRAGKFLRQLSRDPELSEVVYCTAQRPDEQFAKLRNNEVMLERWLLRTLLEPIMGKDIGSLNL